MGAVVSVLLGILLFFLSLSIVMPETNLALTAKLVLCFFSDYFFIYTFIVGFVMPIAKVIYATIIVANIVRMILICREINQNIIYQKALDGILEKGRLVVEE